MSSVFPLSAYEAWAENTPALGAAQAPEQDADNDGTANLAEFATGSDPANPGAFPQLGVQWIGNKLTIILPKASTYDTTAVSGLVEISNNRRTWSSNRVMVVEGTATYLKVEVNSVVAGQPIFARGKFSIP